MNAGRSQPSELEVEADAHVFRLRAESTQRASRARALLGDYIRTYADASAETCEASELIAGELLGNVVRHAPGPFEVLLEWEAAGGVLSVIDTGPGYCATGIGLPDITAESSRGLFIVLAFGARDLRTFRAADGRHVTRVVLPTGKS